MTLLKTSMLRRMVIAQLLTVLMFCIVTTGNLLWQFKKNESGSEVNKDMRFSAQIYLSVLKNNGRDIHKMKEQISIFHESLKNAYDLNNADFIDNPPVKPFSINVRTIEGNDIFRSPDYPGERTSIIYPGSLDIYNGGQQWRQFTLQDEKSGLVVQLAQSTEGINQNIGELIYKFIIVPLIWVIPLVGVVSYHTCSRGLKPLRVLAECISLRSPNDMSPIEHQTAYAETKPIISEINSLLLGLEATLERERQFLADAAHELRTPLAVIQAQAYVLTQASDSNAKATAAADELNAGIERAASLIEKLLLAAKVSVDTYVPSLEVMDLSVFVQERVASMSVLAMNKNIEIELDAPASCPVRLDRETFMSAIDNILDNAIRYTPQRGQIQVTLKLVNSGEQVSLRIADSGSGIPPELRARVFERFFRIAGTEQYGSGLGLAIVKRVLALHGGDVTLASGLRQRGLAVNLTLPKHTANRPYA
jgi:two-component system, OmpR family, sensor histidine kinase QseC